MQQIWHLRWLDQSYDHYKDSFSSSFEDVLKMANKSDFGVIADSAPWFMQQRRNLRRSILWSLTLGLIIPGTKPFVLELAKKVLRAPRLLWPSLSWTTAPLFKGDTPEGHIPWKSWSPTAPQQRMETLFSQQRRSCGIVCQLRWWSPRCKSSRISSGPCPPSSWSPLQLLSSPFIY